MFRVYSYAIFTLKNFIHATSIKIAICANNYIYKTKKLYFACSNKIKLTTFYFYDKI